MIAALYVQTNGVYYGLPDVDPWDEARDARKYAGPYPVVAHPPCERWGRFWYGSPLSKARKVKGDDDGCFAAALKAVREFGGVLEHPEASAAWYTFGLRAPIRGAWHPAGDFIGWTCCVEQAHYGHPARKATWLYAVVRHDDLPSLIWGAAEQRLCPEYLAKHGYEKARRSGIMSGLGGGGNSRRRAATPIPFRDILLSMARSVRVERAA